MMLPASRFRIERHMIRPLIESIPQMVGVDSSKIVRVIREPSVGFVIPDLLIGAWFRASPPKTSIIVTRIDAHVRSLLEKEGPLQAREIVTRLHLSSASFVAALSRLTRSGVVKELEDGLIELDPAARGDRVELIGIEAKLARWHEAIKQAARYLSFTDRAFVVLDGNRVSATPAVMAAALEAGVGLAFQYGRFLRVAAPAPRVPYTPTTERTLAIAKVAASFAKGASAAPSAPGPGDILGAAALQI